MFQLGAERLARAGPIMRFRLQLQQGIANFGMFGFDGKGAFRQLQRRVCITIGQFLLHDAAHPDKAGLFIFHQLAICGLGRAAITCHLSRLCGQQVGQGRLVEVFVGLCGLRHGQLSLAACQRHQSLGQGVKPLAFPIAIKIPRQRRFIAIQELPGRHQQRQQLERQPDHDQQQNNRNDRLQRAKAVFRAHQSQLNAAFAFQQKPGTPGDCGNGNDKEDNLD